MRSILFALLAVAIFATSCAGEETKSTATRKVKCEVVGSADHKSESRSYPGKVEAAEEVNRAFRVAGVIESIKVKEGDFVREGETIATMDRRDYALQLAATEAEYAAIKGEVERVVELYKQQSTTQNNYDKAVSGLKQIEAKLSSHRNALADTELKAPFSGYIQKINFNRGATVAAGMPVISIVSSARPVVVVNIPSNEYLKREGLVGATAESDLYNGVEFPLKHIGTTHKANLNQLYESRFALSPIEGKSLPAGTSVMVKLNYTPSAQTSLSIPLKAVVEREGKTNVWILKDSTATLRTIAIERITTDGRAIISGGVESGEVVITAGVNSLKEGQKVEPLATQTESNIGNIL